MKLTTANGKLRLRSAFKLIFFGWLISWACLFAVVFFLMFLVAIAGGPVTINGELQEGRNAIFGLLALLPVFTLILPIHAAVFSMFICFGLLIYRQFRPIEVEVLEGDRGPDSQGVAN